MVNEADSRLNDFDSEGLTSLGTSFIVEADAMVVVGDILRGFDGRWPQRSMQLRAVYLSENHLVNAHFHFSNFNPKDDDDFMLVRIEWRKGRARTKKLPRRVQSLVGRSQDIDAMMAVLIPVINLASVRCESQYLLEVEQWAPRVALPLVQLPVPGTSLEQISGIRLTGSPINPNEYAILDLLTASAFSVSLSFRPDEMWEYSLFDTLAILSMRMRDCLVGSKDGHTTNGDT